jgi:hypothetical protein
MALKHQTSQENTMRTTKEQLWYQEARSLSYFFHRQIWHLLALLILPPLAWALAAPVLGEGTWLGIADTTWFWLSMGVAVLHQLIVWIVFRLQMGWATLSKVFGWADLLVWGLLFLPFLVLRVVSVVGLAKSTQSSLELPGAIAFLLGIILLIPVIYTAWSVLRYFGLIRAMVGDHFRTLYREMPLVDQGIFKYSSNAMYTFGFLGLWAIGLLIGSQVALCMALFQHAYIWVHYHCTEKPDMEIIYSNDH